MPTFNGKSVSQRGGAYAGRGDNPHHTDTLGKEKCTGAGCNEKATEKSYSGDPMCLNCHQKYDERDS